MQFNPYSFPIILGIGVLSFLMRLVAQRNRGRVVTNFMVFGTAVLLQGTFFSAQLLSANPTVQILFFYLMVFITILIPLAILFFILEYFGYDTWINWKSVSLLIFFPVAAGIMELTDPLHGLFWENLSIVSHDGFTYVHETIGFIPVLITVYLYFILGISLALMFWGLFHIPKQRRQELNLLILALTIPFVFDLVRTFDLNPWPYLYITPYGVIASVILLGISTIKYDFLNAIPAAYSRLFSDVSDAILVFDHKYNLMDLNKAAKHLFVIADKRGLPKGLENFPKALQEAVKSRDIEVALMVGDNLSYFDLRLSELFDKAGLLRSILVTLHDVSDRKQLEMWHQNLLHDKERLLAEKEALLREINHRVKNNFNLAGSLLFLEAQKFDDKKVKAAFEVSRDRLRTMSLLNERLYRSETFNNLDLGNYLCSIAEDLITAQAPRDMKIELKCDADEVIVGPREAIPNGLIVNELITNSLKYAFSENCDHNPVISLKLSQGKDDLIRLRIEDTGCGYPSDFNYEESDSLGMKLVHMLGQDQLGGTVKFGSDQGAFFNLSFFPESIED